MLKLALGVVALTVLFHLWSWWRDSIIAKKAVLEEEKQDAEILDVREEIAAARKENQKRETNVVKMERKV